MLSSLNNRLSGVTTMILHWLVQPFYFSDAHYMWEILLFISIILTVILVLVTNYRLRKEIDRRKQTEEALRNSERDFRTLAENFPEIISRLDKNGRHLYVNPAIQKATGLAPEFFIGKTNEELNMPKTNIEKWNYFIDKTFKTGEPQKLFFDFPSPDGVRNFSALLAPEFDSESSVSSILSVVRDITDQKQTNEELKTLNERLSMATEIASLGVWDWDLQTNTVTWNNKMFEIYGLISTEQVPYTVWARAVHPDDLSQAESDLRRTIIEKSKVFMEFRIIRPEDGSIRYLQAIESAITNEKHKVIRVVGINIDITDQKQNELALRESENKYREVFDNTSDGIFIILVPLCSVVASTRA